MTVGHVLTVLGLVVLLVDLLGGSWLDHSLDDEDLHTIDEHTRYLTHLGHVCRVKTPVDDCPRRPGSWNAPRYHNAEPRHTCERGA